MMALFLSVKLACLYLPQGAILPEPKVFSIAGAVPSPARYRVHRLQARGHFA